MNYPKSLIDELAKYGLKPTGNLEWDREVLHACKARQNPEPFLELAPVVIKSQKEIAKARKAFPDLSDPSVYAAHAALLVNIANDIVLAPQRRPLEIDDNNRNVLRFLLYYFNASPLAEEVFPGRGYKLHKNILLQGRSGVGKTLFMQIFSEYLKRTENPLRFYNVSVTQMVNHYSIHNDIDCFTYNERSSPSFQGKPFNLCLNDIGVENRPFYGIDTNTVVSDFLHARNEIWSNYGEFGVRYAHLTTNLTNESLISTFSSKDAYGRLIDRFKTYNVIPLPGNSRR